MMSEGKSLFDSKWFDIAENLANYVIDMELQVHTSGMMLGYKFDYEKHPNALRKVLKSL